MVSEGSYSFSIDVAKDQEAQVLVGTSEDIPGLTLEAETMGHLYDAIFDIAPQLVKDNLGITKDSDVNIKVRLHGDLPQECAHFLRFSLEEEHV